MNNDDLPPQPREYEGSSFGGAMGATIGRLLWIFLPMAVVLAIALLVIKGTH
jgi:hypothetical protein